MLITKDIKYVLNQIPIRDFIYRDSKNETLFLWNNRIHKEVVESGRIRDKVMMRIPQSVGLRLLQSKAKSLNNPTFVWDPNTYILKIVEDDNQEVQG
jgi:hypothetical protein|uniref:Uncharacterized protein n=1 Tax=Ackermannviridae sp. ctUml7 TaxID=2825753 RepID=A0A8S5V9S3_9CAUD|nr:MAG TPA: hypothetical protein [Ackermannviridae sp. ctUml7]